MSQTPSKDTVRVEKLKPTPSAIARVLTEEMFANRKGHGGADVSFLQISRDTLSEVIEAAINLHVELNPPRAVNDHDRNVETIDILESNARVQAKLLADTGRQRDEVVKALEALEAAEEAHANCDECDGEGVPELCEKCFPLFDDARIKRRATLSRIKTGSSCA